MRIHCLGAGSIGSLIATNLAQLPLVKIRLILRKKDLVGNLFNNSTTTTPTSIDSTSNNDSSNNNKIIPNTISLKLEKEGLIFKTNNLELELIPTKEEIKDLNRKISTSIILKNSKGIGSNSNKFPSIKNLIKNDLIKNLIITTKANSILNSLKPLLNRLNFNSNILLCHNGMGVLERLLDNYFPEDNLPDSSSTSSSLSSPSSSSTSSSYKSTTSRPNFICAITTHGVWKKSPGHFVHAGEGDLKFTLIPNKSTLASIASTPNPTWGDNLNNPILNSKSLILPNLSHIPLTPSTESLHFLLKTLLDSKLNVIWLPLKSYKILSLQKLSLNININLLTSLLEINNGSLIGSNLIKSLIKDLSSESSNVFAAHLANENGDWLPPPSSSSSSSSFSSSTEIIDDEEEDSIQSRDFPNTSPSSSSSSSSSSRAIRQPPSPPPVLPTSHPLSTTSIIDYTLRVLFSTSSNISSTLQDILRLSTSSSSSSSLSPSNSKEENEQGIEKEETEINYISGYLLSLARIYSIETPVIKTLDGLLRFKILLLKFGDNNNDLVFKKRLDDLGLTSATKTEEVGGRSLEKPTSEEEVVESGVKEKRGKGKKKEFIRAERINKVKIDRVDTMIRNERDRRM